MTPRNERNRSNTEQLHQVRDQSRESLREANRLLEIEIGLLDEMDVDENIARRRELTAAQNIMRRNRELNMFARHAPFERIRVQEHSLGPMNIVCIHCRALRFACESPTRCCKEGKIDLQPFCNPPLFLLNKLQEDKGFR